MSQVVKFKINEQVYFIKDSAARTKIDSLQNIASTGSFKDLKDIPEFKIGTVSSIKPNQQPSVNIVKTESAYIFDFKLPKGDKGDGLVINSWGETNADRDPYNLQQEGFTFLNIKTGILYYKLSNKNKDWSNGVNFCTPSLLIEYSKDNINFHTNYSSDDLYLRFSNNNGSSWLSGIRFQGEAATIKINNVITGAPGTSAIISNVSNYHNAVLDITIPRGDIGPTGTINIGNVITIDAGSNARIEKYQNETYDDLFDFYIPKGDAATIQIGEVTTAEAGVSPEVTNSGTLNSAILNFKLPKGNAGQIFIGNVITAENGVSASVKNISGTSTSAILDFVIPKGDKGQINSVSIQLIDSSITSVYNDGTRTEADIVLNIPRNNQWFVGTNLVLTENKLSGFDTNIKFIKNDYALQSVLGDIYKCLSDGNINDSTWQYKGNIRGASFKIDGVGTYNNRPNNEDIGYSYLILDNENSDLDGKLIIKLSEDTWSDPISFKGESGQIYVGKVITGDPGTNAQVVNTSGTSTSAILDFVIPKGDKGEGLKIDAVGDMSILSNYNNTSKGFSFYETSKGFIYIKETDDDEYNWSIPIKFKGTDANIEIGNVYIVSDINSVNVIKRSQQLGSSILDFYIPKGDKGDNNSLTIGKVIEGEHASAWISGETPNQKLNLVLPKGNKGDKGNNGDNGCVTIGSNGNWYINGKDTYRTATGYGCNVVLSPYPPVSPQEGMIWCQTSDLSDNPNINILSLSVQICSSAPTSCADGTIWIQQ